MNIAIFTDTFYPPANGIFTSISNSTREMVRNGHNVILFVPKSEKTPPLDKRVKVVKIGSFRLPFYSDYRVSYPNTFSCLGKIYGFKPDVIHIHSPFSIGMVGLFCSKYFGIPAFGTYHTLFSEFMKHFPVKRLRNKDTFSSLTVKYANFLYNRCDLVIAPSNMMKSELKAQGIHRPIEVVSNGINQSKFHAVSGKGVRKKYGLERNYILHFGRLSYEKDVGIVLKAFKVALEKNPRIHLVIAGEGPALESLKEESKAMGISKSVLFTGFVPDSDLPGLISEADFFVTASTIETQGLAILEAMACGLPVIGVDSLATPELVKNGKNGFLTEPGNYVKMGASIANLSGNKKLRAKMGAISLKLAMRHSLENTVNGLEHIYHSQIKLSKRENRTKGR